jgi:hypothetical protein
MSEKCLHEKVFPDGDCVKCGVLATMCPGLSDAHEMVPWPDDSEIRDDLFAAAEDFARGMTEEIR